MIGSGQKFGKYTLLERIAEGGMAEIYKASVIGSDGREHIVALKRLHRAFCEDPELTAMLVDEARIAVQLRHPHVAQVFDLGSIDLQHFLVMEFVPGHDLHELLNFARQKRLYIPIPAVILTLIHVADALQYAHTRHDADGRPLSIVHRDVSPQNIMISTRGEVKLVDFGIAKAKNRAQVTQHGIIKGKYYYMSPEQAHGHHVDGRTDIYALGMVLYEGLTGRSPFEDVPEAELLKHVRQSSFPPPSYYRPDIDPELDSIVERMTQRDPSLRYQTMADVRAALADFGTRKLAPFGPSELALTAEELAEVRPTVEYDILQPAAYAPSESSMIFNVESGLLELHSSEFEILEEEGERLFETGPNPFGQPGDDATMVYNEQLHEPQPMHPQPSQPYQQPAPHQQQPSAQHQQHQPAQHQPGHQQPAHHQPAGHDAAQAHPGGAAYREQSYQEAEPQFSPNLAFDPRSGGTDSPTGYAKQASERAQHPQREQQPSPGPAMAPDFNAGRRPESRKEGKKSGSSPLIYGLVVLAVVLLGVLGALVFMGDDDGEAAAAVQEPVAETTPEATPAEPEETTVPFAVASTPPNAKIFLDGEEMGSTPKLLQLEPGAKHELVLKRPGYATFTSDIEAGKDEEVAPQLELASGILKIQSYPPGAVVKINDREVGKTNLTESGLPLDQKLKVVAELDEKTLEKEVVWNPEEEPIQEMMFEFEKPPATEEAVAVSEEPAKPKTVKRRRPRRRRTVSRPKPKKEEKEEFNIWSKPKNDEPEDLNVWGGSSKKKKKPKKKEEKKEEKEDLNIWGK